jgi:hypothetical protein
VTSNQKQKCSFHLDFGISLADDNSINTASEKLGNIFAQAAEMSLKKQKPRNKNKPKNPKWFNGNLFSYGKVYTTYPKDPAVKK